MLFRALYIRDGRVRGCTFVSDSPEHADAWAERYVANLRRYWRDVQLLTVNFAKPAKGSTRPLI